MKNQVYGQKNFLYLLMKGNIKIIQTLAHTHTIERFILKGKTFKDNLYRRLGGLNQDNNEWVKHVKNMVGKYNNTVHFTIEKT